MADCEALAQAVGCPTCGAHVGAQCVNTWTQKDLRGANKRSDVSHWRRMRRALGYDPQWWRKVVGAS